MSGPKLGPHSDTRATSVIGNAVAYRSADGVDAAVARLLLTGAATHRPSQADDGGIRVVPARDLFSNVTGVIHNPNFAISPDAGT